MATQLTKEQCRFIRNIIDDHFSDEVRIREKYSGRGMMGANCFGFVIGMYTTGFRFAFQLAHLISLVSAPHAEELLELLSTASVRSDSMGHDFIVYFPSLEWNDEEEEESQEDEEE